MTDSGVLRKSALLGVILLLLGLFLGAATAAYAKQTPEKADKVTICHKPGTEDEQTLESPARVGRTAISTTGILLENALPLPQEGR